jgi:uncharacterized protein with ATP-grasp and redox domains
VALKYYPKLKFIFENSEDPLLAAAKVAIIGNVIDFGPKVDIKEKDMLSNELAINYINQLNRSILGSWKALYLADNAGETVFDRILI